MGTLGNLSPGSVDPGWKPVGAGFCGVSGLRAWLVDGSRGTVGKPGGEGDTKTAHRYHVTGRM